MSGCNSVNNELLNNAEKYETKYIKDSYVIIPNSQKEDIFKYYYENNKGFHSIITSLECEKIGSNSVYYDKEIYNIFEINNLFTFLNEIYEQDKAENFNLAYRGHSDANYYLISSLLRGEQKKEDDYYYDIIKNNPRAFKDARYHLDYLKTMQHYGADTRILDITTNILNAVYFAASGKKSKENTGEVIVWNKGNLNHKKVNRKRFNSDSVEILASLAPLNSNLKKKIKKRAKIYCKKIKNPNNNDLIIEGLIKEFNDDVHVKKLIHEVGQVRFNFEAIINPCDLFKVFFSDSTFDNERITNQTGEFIIHGFTKEYKLNKILNSIRFSKSTQKTLYLINNEKKSEIMQQLKILGVKKDNVYPSLEHTIDVIYEREDRNEI